jgi:hypothetical protein
MEATYNSDYSYSHQDSFYDFNDSSFSPLPEDQSGYIAPSSSLTPLWNNWNMYPQSPQNVDGNESRRSNSVGSDGSDPLLEFISSADVSIRDQDVNMGQDGEGMGSFIQDYNQQHIQQQQHHHQQQQQQIDMHQQSPSNAPTMQQPEEQDLQSFFDTTLPFDFDTWNDLCATDKHLATTTEVFTTPSIGRPVSGSVSSQFDQPEGNLPTYMKRKASTASGALSTSRKKRIVSKSQQNTGKKDIISCVIASLPVSVLEEQQKAIPTAFPSRMRQTRIQAAIKAQTDAMVQSCQQRIMKNTIVDLNGCSVNASQQSIEGVDGQGVQYIGAYTLEERRLRIARFHEKRKQRIWQHTVKYNCRRKLAVGRVRVKGRFVKTED